MSEQNYRTIGALCGLAIGFGSMFGLGYGGVLPAALFGAGGCVCGGIAAEKLHRWNKKRGH